MTKILNPFVVYAKWLSLRIYIVNKLFISYILFNTTFPMIHLCLPHLPSPLATGVPNDKGKWHFFLLNLIDSIVYNILTFLLF